MASKRLALAALLLAIIIALLWRAKETIVERPDLKLDGVDLPGLSLPGLTMPANYWPQTTTLACLCDDHKRTFTFGSETVSDDEPAIMPVYLFARPAVTSPAAGARTLFGSLSA